MHPATRSGAVLASLAVALLTRIAAAQTTPAPDAQPAPLPAARAPEPVPAPAAPAATTAPAQARPADPPQPTAPTAPTARASDPEIAELRDEVRALRAQVESLKALPQAPLEPPPRPASSPLNDETFWPWIIPPEGLAPSAYIQSEYYWNQSSQDQLSQSGTTLNQDRFLIRRGRLGVTGEWQYVAAALELDGNTTNGPSFGLRRAEASLQYRPDRARPPLVMATMGLFDVPFGFELVEPARYRWFMERTTASTAFFPSEPDLGLRIAGALGWFRWTIAAMNGEPLGEPGSFALEDPNASKDLVFRFGFNTTPIPDFNVAGDVSALQGTGFSPGTAATKATLQWTDTNEDGAVQASELVGIPGEAATPSQNFGRWEVGVDLRTEYRWKPGILKIYGEFVLAANMDRSLYVANPVLTGIDQRELGWYVAALQEVTKYGMVGLRYDYYDPNSNVFDSRAGQLIPYSEAIKTISPLVGLALPDRARLIFQYDFNTNALARTAEGVPTNLADNGWTIRLQVQM